MGHGLEHLQGQRDTSAEVLVVDFDNLICVNGTVSNVNEWGCSLASEQINELSKNIAIRVDEGRKLTKATLTAVKGGVAAIVFPKQDTARVQDKRREQRNEVSIKATVSDRKKVTEISGLIVDAGRNGCRIKAKGLESLPDEILLQLPSLENPVLAEFAWRNSSSGGIRIIWDEPDSIG
ncbi:PilZ domain-containing protein [Roseibium algae]|uniref:PilZ domain-containing protein n=1 Tax=Roseibium algae TaxID=3123038 RepID=A0ABU8TM41_9HYPH